MKYKFFWKQNEENLLRDSDGLSPDEALIKWRDKYSKPVPVEPYAISSVERNMYLCYLDELLELSNPEDKDEIRERFKECLRLTPYTRWSGD